VSKPSINLNQMLYNLDMGNKEWYNSLDSELKKTFSSYVSMRFASSVKSNKILQESYIESVNEFCNKYFSTIQKHEGDSLLFWKLLCLCGSGQKQFHPWLKAPKGKGKKTKIFDFLQSCYPNYKNDEIETLISVLDKKEIKELAKQAGLDDKEIKLLIK
tara:strand:+ start:4259 stop:4735 length:477 start_codon:yes stop_codon:yes gene_type:complete